MTENLPQLFQMCIIGAILLFIIGVYYLLVTRNLIRAVIALEILTKAVTLLIILAGYITGRTGLAQAMAITLIVIEVVVIAVAVGIVLWIFRHNKSISANLLKNIKG